jgi:hypothetical protein
MREIRTSGSMSGDGKRGVGHRPQATAPILDSTDSEHRLQGNGVGLLRHCGHSRHRAGGNELGGQGLRHHRKPTRSGMVAPHERVTPVSCLFAQSRVRSTATHRRPA